MNREFDGQLLAKIVELGLPHTDTFVLTSSGALAERGVIPIEEVGDIDGVTSLENITYLRRKIGWKAIRRTVGYGNDGRRVRVMSIADDDGRFDIYPWDFSLLDHRQTGNGRIQLPELIESSDQDPATGIWVARIDYVERTKRATGRPKDEARLRAIDAHRKDTS